MINRSLGRRYAKALFELAVEGNVVAEVRRSVEGLQKLWDESNDLRLMVSDPTLPRQTAKSVFVDVLTRANAHALLVKLVELVTDRGRLPYLPDMLSAFIELAEAQANDTRVEVTTPAAMPDDFYNSLVNSISRKAPAKITLVKNTDPSLIGGVVVRIGDRIFDGSLRSRLEDIKESLRQGLAAS